jgi:glycosyltransferase involved in cell wall biosynthesis
VGGDAVEYTEPDADSIAASLRKLINDPQRRATLSQSGPRRARDFTWESSAAAHRASYVRAVSGVVGVAG